MAQSINYSNINFSDLIPPSIIDDVGSNSQSMIDVAGSNSQLVHKQKKNRRDPIITIREDNLDSNLDDKLKHALELVDIEDKPTAQNDRAVDHDIVLYNPQLDNKSSTNLEQVKADLTIDEPIITDFEKPPEPISLMQASAIEVKKPKRSKRDRCTIDLDPTKVEAEINKRIVIIHHYQNSTIFGKYLKELGVHYTMEQLNKKDVSGLDKIINQMRILCQNKQSTASLDSMLFGVTSMVENVVTQRTNYNMKGYTELLKADAGLLEAWELIKIERLSFARMSPELRFAYGLGINAIAIVNINKSTAEGHIKANTGMRENVPKTEVNVPKTELEVNASVRENTNNTSDRHNLVFNGNL